MGTTSKLVDGAVDFGDWNLEVTDSIAAVIAKAALKGAEQALQIAVEEGAHIYFPIYWAPRSDGRSSPAVTDPLTVYVVLPLDGGGDGVALQFNIRDALSNDIAECRQGGENNGMSQLSAALKSLAADIDEAIAHSPRSR